MAAKVLLYPVVSVFLLVFPIFFSNTISFTRDELLNIRQNTPQNCLPVFDYSDVLLNTVVGGSNGAVKTVQDAQTEEASRRALEAQTARISNAVA